MNQKKKAPNYRKNKAAFDEVLTRYRQSRQHNGLGAASWSASKGATADPAKPNVSEFRADVEKIIEALVAVKYLPWFWAAYSWYDSEDAIERGMFAHLLLKGREHSYEQRLGARFVEVGLFPTMLYFNHKRVS